MSEEEEEEEEVAEEEDLQPADLDLLADKDVIRCATLKRAPQMSATELEKLTRQLDELTKKVKDVRAVVQERERKYAALTLFAEAGHIPYDLEWTQILRPRALKWPLYWILIAGSTFYTVRKSLAIDDAFWRQVFLRDFSELENDFGEGWDRLPLWITENPKSKEQEPAYALVPWRRYYMWWEFFRRSCLRELEPIYRQRAGSWLVHAQWSYHPVNQWPINVSLLPGQSLVVEQLRVPAVHMSDRSHYGMCLEDVATSRYSYYPSIMSLRNGPRYDADHVPEDWLARQLSPAFWYAYELEDGFARGVTRDINTWNMTATPNAPSLASRRSFLAGQETRLLPAIQIERPDLNFDYRGVMRGLLTWYMRSFKEAAAPEITRHRVVRMTRFVESDDDTEISNNEILWTLPAVPRVNTVLYLHAPICSGCGVQGAMKIQCKKCGNPYCNYECHSVNWDIGCKACTRDPAAAAEHK